MNKTIILSIILSVLGVAHAGGVEPEPLTLRVHDATVTPGGLAAVVLRTYASRPIRQGQVCIATQAFRSSTKLSQPGLKAGVMGNGPFVTLENVIVFSDAGDAIEQADLIGDGDAQVTLLTFSSKSATVNASDGPLLALFYRVRPDLVPGEQLDIIVDLANTALYDEQGQPILVEGRNGELRIRAPADPVSLAIASETPENGQVLLGLQTDEVLQISSGQFAFNYSPLLTGRPKVFIDPRHGNGTPTVSWLRGQIVVQFDSPDNTLGYVPGDIVGIAMQIMDTADPTIDRSIWLDPAQTFLYDGDGATITLDLEGDVIP